MEEFFLVAGTKGKEIVTQVETYQESQSFWGKGSRSQA